VIHVDGTVCRSALSRWSQSHGASAGSAAIASAAVDWMDFGQVPRTDGESGSNCGGGCAAAIRTAGVLIAVQAGARLAVSGVLSDRRLLRAGC